MFRYKLAAIFLLCAVLLCSCTKQGENSTGSNVTGQTAVETDEQTDISDSGSSMPMPTATPFPKYAEEYAGLVDEFTIKLPGYESIERETPKQIKKINKSRYVRYSDGWYRNPDSDSQDSAALMFTGDLMCQGRQQEAALEKYDEYNFNKSFIDVRRIFDDADLVVGNLETTLYSVAPYMSEQSKVDDKPHCNAPATYLDALRYAGFDALVMANNHNCDTGVKGILETIDNVNRYKLMHTGTFADEDEQRYLLIDVNGFKIALMSYATYFNTKDAYITEEGQRLMLNRYTRQLITRDVQDARADGAELIIAYNHWGTEYVNEETENQRKYAQEMANAGVDYIIGSHPHALQRYDIIKANDGREVPVVYSMGNFLSHMTKDMTKDTIILRLDLKRTSDGIEISDGFYACRVLKKYKGIPYRIVPIASYLTSETISDELSAAYERITEVMGDKIECLDADQYFADRAA